MVASLKEAFAGDHAVLATAFEKEVDDIEDRVFAQVAANLENRLGVDRLAAALGEVSRDLLEFFVENPKVGSGAVVERKGGPGVEPESSFARPLDEPVGELAVPDRRAVFPRWWAVERLVAANDPAVFTHGLGKTGATVELGVDSGDQVAASSFSLA